MTMVLVMPTVPSGKTRTVASAVIASTRRSVADFSRNITNANYASELLAFMDVSQEFWDSLTEAQQNDMSVEFEQARKGENLTGLTELQQQVIQHYEDGSFAYIKSVADAEKVGAWAVCIPAERSRRCV